MWSVSSSQGSADELHQRPIPDDPVPTVWVHETTGPALVLGSAQSPDILYLDRCRRDGIEVCQRRSGGGVVALVPGDHCWIDVVLPRRSPLWDDDIGRAAHWVGEAWAAAVDELVPGRGSSVVHRGQLRGRAEGRLVCFAGLGPGEVTVDGRKVVGLSQRRTRTAARFQTVFLWRWRPTSLSPYLRPGALAAAGLDLADLDVGLVEVGPVTGAEIVPRFLSHLPDPGR